MNDQVDELKSEEITLRCNRCGKPISPGTAVATPTGYRCKECVLSQQKIFDTAKPLDIPLALILSGALAFLGSWLTSFIGFFTILLAPAAGMLIAEVVRRVVKKRRSKALSRSVLWGTIVGGSILLFFRLLGWLFGLILGSLDIFALLPMAYQGIFIALSASSAYYGISGIRLK